MFAIPLTFGWKRMKLYGLRETRGRLRVAVLSSVAPRSVLSGLVGAPVAVTSTCVVDPATCIGTLTVTDAPAFTSMPDRLPGVNPGTSTSSSYLPSGNRLNRNRPESPVLPIWRNPVPRFVMFTAAFAITEPVGSVTVPEISPFMAEACPKQVPRLRSNLLSVR